MTSYLTAHAQSSTFWSSISCSEDVWSVYWVADPTVSASGRPSKLGPSIKIHARVDASGWALISLLADTRC